MKVTFKVPSKRRMRGAPIETQCASGKVAFFKIGDDKVKFVLQEDERGEATCLTHYASGMIFGRLNGPKLEAMLARGNHARLSDRGAAEVLIAQAIAVRGVEEVLKTIHAAPVLNQ